MANSNNVLIVGSGPTGLVLALQLAHYKIPFRIIDKNSGPGQASRAMAVQARTLELYDRQGMADEIISRGIKIENIRIRTNGEYRAKANFANLGQGISPYSFPLSFPQDDHERYLVEKLRSYGVEVEWNTELEDFIQGENTVMVTLNKNGATEHTGFAYLCGCDGAHSAVREGLRLEFSGGSYDELFYVADVKVNEDTGNDIIVNFEPKSFGLVMPVRSSGMKRFIGVVPPELSDGRVLTFEDMKPYAERIFDMKVEEVNWSSFYHVHHRVAEKFRVGRCFIAGDAGHIHSPAGGQGMNTGICDAVNLGWKLAAVIQERANHEILRSYEQERVAFAKLLIKTTDNVFSVILDKGLPGKFLRDIFMPYILPRIVKIPFLGRIMFRIVSQTSMKYRNSVLSMTTSAGSLHAGDRLPWTGHNFASLHLMDWQLHVYGTTNSDIMHAARDANLKIHVFELDQRAKDAGYKSTAYLVRPDAYIALITEDAEKLKSYIQKFKLRFM